MITQTLEGTQDHADETDLSLAMRGFAGHPWGKVTATTLNLRGSL